MPFLVRYIFDDVFTAKNASVLQMLPFAILAVFVFRGRHGVEVAEQLVGAVDEMDVHGRAQV